MTTTATAASKCAEALAAAAARRSTWTAEQTAAVAAARVTLLDRVLNRAFLDTERTVTVHGKQDAARVLVPDTVTDIAGWLAAL